MLQGSILPRHPMLLARVPDEQLSSLLIPSRGKPPKLVQASTFSRVNHYLELHTRQLNSSESG
jgi:hypothetical protein